MYLEENICLQNKCQSMVIILGHGEGFGENMGGIFQDLTTILVVRA